MPTRCGAPVLVWGLSCISEDRAPTAGVGASGVSLDLLIGVVFL
jgi:hypothetical protein